MIQNQSINISDTKRWYLTKKFWGTLLISIALWIYASLSNEYKTVVDVLLIVEPPKGRAVEEAIPDKILVDIAGNGWYLFNYMYLNKMKRCYVRLDDVLKDDSLYIVSNMDMQKGLANLNKITTHRFYPDQIKIKTGEITSKEVKVVSDIDIVLKNGFVLVSSIKTEPQNITIVGNSQLIASIKEWRTKKIQFNGINSSFSLEVPVSDSLSSVIETIPNKFTVFASVEPYGEVTFDDVELQVVGGKLPAEHNVTPQFFSVTLSGGIELLNKINASNISLVVDYESLINDKVGFLKPVITVPPFTKVLNISPDFLRHNISIKHRG